MSTRKKSISTRRTGARVVVTNHPSVETRASQPTIDAIRMSYEVESAGPAIVDAPSAQAPSIEPHTPAIPIVPAVACDRCGTLHHLNAPTYATLGAVMIGEDGAAVTERLVRVCLEMCVFEHLSQVSKVLGEHKDRVAGRTVDLVNLGRSNEVGGVDSAGAQMPSSKLAYPLGGMMREAQVAHKAQRA